MRKRLLTFAAVGLLATATMTACDSSDDQTSATTTTSNTAVGKGDGKARVGVILPDTVSAQRWGTADPKYLKAAFQDANVPVEVENAQGNPADFVKIAQNMIASGVKVLIIASIDSVSGKAALDAAHAKKIPTIDYDRLTLNGGADYYVTFDGGKVGQLQAYGLSKCLANRHRTNPVVAEINGSPTDNNATLFKAGYDSVLDLKYDSGEYQKGPDQSVPDWKPEGASAIFSQMLTQRPDISGVLSANDGMAGAVISVLKKKGMNGRVPVTGQDASVAGLQAILAGDQCMTVYKPIKPEAEAAAGLAVQLFKGQKPHANDQLKDPVSGAYIPTILEVPQSITIDNVGDVIKDGFATYDDVCKGAYAKACRDHDVTKQ
jgi:D-xylose transport system substrate-binding protein